MVLENNNLNVIKLCLQNQSEKIMCYKNVAVTNDMLRGKYTFLSGALIKVREMNNNYA